MKKIERVELYEKLETTTKASNGWRTWKPVSYIHYYDDGTVELIQVKEK